MTPSKVSSVELAAKLFAIYLRDDSERANTEVIRAIAESFGADLGALFYVNAKRMFKFCLVKSGFPISLPEDRWRASIPKRLREAGLHAFDDWAPPGIDVPVAHWLGIKLDNGDAEPSYMFIGKNADPWRSDEAESFSLTAKIISEIVTVRYARELEIRNRHEAEDALKLVQTRMSTFFEMFRDAIYTLDSEERFTSVNHAGLMLFGVEDKSQIVGKPFSDFTSDPGAHAFFRRKIREAGFINDFEIVIVRPDGTATYCLETAHTVKDADGNVQEIQGLLKDISERIKNERDLWEMNFELTKANQELKEAQAMLLQQEKLASIGQLAAGVAHEINNPLGFLKSNQTMLRSYFESLKGVLEGLRDAVPEAREACAKKDIPYITGEAAHIFDESDEGFARIKKIVSNLMKFARAGNVDEFADCDVNECVESALSVARNELKYVADVELKLGQITKICANEGEINQVLLNLIVNAAQAIDSQKRKDRGRISIETKQAGNSVVIVISDDGPGIPKEIQSRVFDPFFTTKDPGKGTGLGLSISFDIVVSKHNGSLSVDSEPAKGTSFTITLPVTQPDVPPIESI
jgi:two-component system, NtrC family, sensor kinase